MQKSSSAEKSVKATASCQIFISLFLVGSLLGLTACSGLSTTPSARNSTSTGSTPFKIAVTVSPNSATLQSGQSLQFTALVTAGSDVSSRTLQFEPTPPPAPNTAVTWRAQLGSVTSSGVYTAPKVASQTTDTISVTSAADPTQHATASVVVESAGVSGGGQITVSVSPNSRTLQSGQTLHFTANVTGTNQTGITWSAVMGSVTSSGLYTAPQVTSQTSDSVSAVSVADATKYATAQVVIQGPPQSAVWSITDQQPVTAPFYPGTLWTTPLPADAGSHLYTNSDNIITSLFGGSDTSGTFSVAQTTPATSSGGNGFYYSSQSDPVFRVNAGSGPCPPSGNSLNCAVGKYFHFPSGAQYDSCQSDENIIIWDQSSDIDPTPGGRLVFSYFFNSGPCGTRSLPTTCTATTPAQADAQSQCQLAFYYNAVNFPYNDSSARGDGVQSDGMATAGNYLREQEIIQGSINHAIGLDTTCEASVGGVAQSVFPAVGVASACPGTDSLHFASGALVWIDATYNCASLPAWQKPVCVAMQTYGGYVHATGGAGVASINPLEGGVAHTVSNLNDPMFNEPNPSGTTAWIIANTPGLSCPSGGYPKVCTGSNGIQIVEDSPTTSHKVVFSWFNMPGLITGHHLHIIDPCIPKRMAGQPGGC